MSLGLRHQLGMVHVETAWRADSRLLPPDTGAVMPMRATAMGRAWLCRASALDRKAVLNQIRVRDPATAQRFEDAVERAMTKNRMALSQTRQYLSSDSTNDSLQSKTNA